MSPSRESSTASLGGSASRNGSRPQERQERIFGIRSAVPLPVALRSSTASITLAWRSDVEAYRPLAVRKRISPPCRLYSSTPSTNLAAGTWAAPERRKCPTSLGTFAIGGAMDQVAIAHRFL
jgi:hypothetical protein